LTVLSHIPDTLIVRKLGPDMAAEVSRRATDVLAGVEPIESFDDWLRSDGHRRNPGATADLLTAALFISLADGTIRVSEALNSTMFDPKS
jgi:triphosphoribosyl-dephospho-CoA synthase